MVDSIHVGSVGFTVYPFSVQAFTTICRLGNVDFVSKPALGCSWPSHGRRREADSCRSPASRSRFSAAAADDNKRADRTSYGRDHDLYVETEAP